MKKNIMSNVVCPLCKRKLVWNILKQDRENIIDAQVKCSECNKHFMVKNSIAVFLVEDDCEIEELDYFNERRNRLENLEMNKKQALLNLKPSSLNASDISFLIDIYRSNNDYSKVIKLKMLERYKKYDKKYLKVMQKHIIDLAKNVSAISGSRIIDLATGHGTLLKEIIHRTNDKYFVATDISYSAMKELQIDLKSSGDDGRVDLFVASAKYLPFCNSFFDVAVSLYGIFHVKDLQCFVSEVMRIISKDFWLIENFYSERASLNTEYLINMGYKDVLGDSIKSNLQNMGFKMEVLDKQGVKILPTEEGKFINMRANSFPLVEEIVDNLYFKISNVL